MNVAHLAIGLFNATWQSAALILATAFGLRACRTVGARARCTLWSAVFFLSAVLPFADLAMQHTIVMAPPGLDALPARATAPLHPSTRIQPRTGAARVPVTQQHAAVASIGVAAAQPHQNPFVAPQRALQSLAGVLLALYLLGVAFFGVRLAREILLLLALKRRCRPIDGDPFLLGSLPRGARLALSDEIEIPCVLGFGRPLVVLPADMPASISAADLRHVVGHEAAHLDRYDDWTNLIEQAVLAAFFFNPAMHFAVRQIGTEREIACDDRVVMREGDTVTYAECLASLVHRAGCSRRLPAPGFHAGPRQIVVRIERLLDRAYSRSRRFGAGIAVTAAVVLFLAAAGIGHAIPVIADEPPLAPLAPLASKKLAPLQSSKAAPPAPVSKSVAPPALAHVAPVASSARLAMQPQASAPRVAPVDVPAPVSVPPAAAPASPPDQPSHRGDSLIGALAASGYGQLSVDELVTLSDRGITGNEVRAYAQLFGHPTIDELRLLAEHGVTPTWVARVQAAGLRNLTPAGAITLADRGISSREIASDLRVLPSPATVNDVLRLHDSGVH